VELTKGEYKIPDFLGKKIDAMKAAGIEPLLVFGYGNPIYGISKPSTDQDRQAFSSYAQAVVKMLKGRVKYYEIWNEWETKVGGTERGEPQALVALEKLVCPALKVIDPQIVVLGGGISSDGLGREWFDEYAKAGGGKACDGLAIHPYSYQFKRNRGPEIAIDRIEKIRAQLARHQGGYLQNIYITEVGYPVYSGFGGVADKKSSAYLPRFYALAASKPWVKGVWWYSLRDQGKDPNNKEHHFGLYTPGLEYKSSGIAFKSIANWLNSSPTRPRVTASQGAYKATASDRNTLEWRFERKSDSSLATRALDKFRSSQVDDEDDDEPVFRKK
jgi:hypothetical protein